MKPPKDDAEYFERLTKSVFTAGLNWTVVENKWPDFQKAFAQFSLPKVAKFNGRGSLDLPLTVRDAPDEIPLTAPGIQAQSKP